jgi:hypothetical protein
LHSGTTSTVADRKVKKSKPKGMRVLVLATRTSRSLHGRCCQGAGWRACCCRVCCRIGSRPLLLPLCATPPRPALSWPHGAQVQPARAMTAQQRLWGRGRCRCWLASTRPCWGACILCFKAFIPRLAMQPSCAAGYGCKACCRGLSQHHNGNKPIVQPVYTLLVDTKLWARLH